jgi:hypothetical protein
MNKFTVTLVAILALAGGASARGMLKAITGEWCDDNKRPVFEVPSKASCLMVLQAKRHGARSEVPQTKIFSLASM